MIAVVVSWVWTLTALAGVVVNLYAVADAKVDRYYAQHHIHKGTRSLVANSNIRRERVRLIIQIAFSAAGMLSILMPAPEALKGTRALIGGVMVIASLLTVYNSLADRFDRKKLLSLIDEQEEHRRRNEAMRHYADEMKELRNKGFQSETEDSLRSLKDSAIKAAAAAEEVADNLAGSQGRADAIEGEPGEAADEASRSSKEEN